MEDTKLYNSRNLLAHLKYVAKALTNFAGLPHGQQIFSKQPNILKLTSQKHIYINDLLLLRFFWIHIDELAKSALVFENRWLGGKRIAGRSLSIWIRIDDKVRRNLKNLFKIFLTASRQLRIQNVVQRAVKKRYWIAIK